MNYDSQVNYAVTVDHVADVYASFGEPDQAIFTRRLIALRDQFFLGVGQPQPYYVVPDHSLLVSLRDAEKGGERAQYYAALAFFHFLAARTGYDVRLAVSPANLYEWNGARPLEKEEQFTATLETMHARLTPLGLTPFVIGFRGYREARKHVKSIAKDVKTISAALSYVKAKEWEFNLRHGESIYFPPYITDPLVPKMRLKYFSPHYVHLLLRSVIDSRLIQKCPDRYVRANLRVEGVERMASLLKLRKGRLQGVGDLELLTVCSISSQFYQNKDHTMIGLTFDETLAKVLRYHAAYSVDSEPVVAGVDDQESIGRKMKDWRGRMRHERRVDVEKDAFLAEFGEFLTELVTAIKGKLSSHDRSPV